MLNKSSRSIIILATTKLKHKSPWNISFQGRNSTHTHSFTPKKIGPLDVSFVKSQKTNKLHGYVTTNKTHMINTKDPHECLFFTQFIHNVPIKCYKGPLSTLMNWDWDFIFLSIWVIFKDYSILLKFSSKFSARYMVGTSRFSMLPES